MNDVLNFPDISTSASPAVTFLDPNPRNWPEDAGHENGAYFNQCHICQNSFIGHKRRLVCKVCANTPIAATVKDLAQKIAHCDDKQKVGDSSPAQNVQPVSAGTLDYDPDYYRILGDDEVPEEEDEWMTDMQGWQKEGKLSLHLPVKEQKANYNPTLVFRRRTHRPIDIETDVRMEGDEFWSDTLNTWRPLFASLGKSYQSRHDPDTKYRRPLSAKPLVN